MTRISRRERFVLSSALLVFCAGLFVSPQAASAAATSQVNATAKVAVCGNGMKEGGEHCDGSDLGAVGCPGVGFDGGTLACRVSCEYAFSGCTTAATVVDVVTISAATGGQHTTNNADGTYITVDVPAAFHAGDVQMLVYAYPQSAIAATKPPPAGTAFVGRVFGLKFVDQDGTALATLLKPAAIVLGYAQGVPAGYDESTIVPYRRPDGASAWQSIGGGVVDTQDDTLTFSMSSFSLIAAFASLPSSSPSGSSGGGGSSGGRPNPAPALAPASVTFSGQAYPGGVVTLLRDGESVATAVADARAAFTVAATGTVPGAHTFGLYADDANGTRSMTLTYPVIAAPGGAAVINDVFFPPTIEADTLEVRQGQSIRIKGHSVPNGEIAVSRGLGGDSVARVKTNRDGSFEFSLDTTSVEAGEYTLRAKAEREQRASAFGKSLRLIVRSRTIPFSLPKFLPRDGAGGVARAPEGSSSGASVALSDLAAPAAPTREVFGKDEEKAAEATRLAKRPRRSIVARLFGWLTGLVRTFLAFATR